MKKYNKIKSVKLGPTISPPTCTYDLWCNLKKNLQVTIDIKNESNTKAEAIITARYNTIIKIDEKITILHDNVRILMKNYRALESSYKSCFNSVENGQDNLKVTACYKKYNDLMEENTNNQKRNIELMGLKKEEIISANTDIKQAKKDMKNNFDVIKALTEQIAVINKVCANTNPKPACP
jgi:uncharacterized protein YhaN